MTFTLSQNPRSPISHEAYLITRLALYLALIMIVILIPLRASAQLSNVNNPETNTRSNIEAQPNSAPNLAAQPALRGEINRSAQSDYRPSAQDYTDLSQAAAHPRVQLQRGARLDKLSTLMGFNFQRIASRLGNIQSLTLDEDSTLYSTDRRTGRVFVMPDRDKNGRPEQIRPLPYRFKSPNAVAIIGDDLFIADKEAIWKLPKSQQSQRAPERLANLQNSQNLGQFFLITQPKPSLDNRRQTPNSGPQNSPLINANAPSLAGGTDLRGGSAVPRIAAQQQPRVEPIIARTQREAADKSQQNMRLILGYTNRLGTARIIAIDPINGQAQLLEENQAALLALKPSPDGRIWRAFKDDSGLYIGTDFNTASPLGASLNIHGLALPHRQDLPQNWPQYLHDHILLSQDNPAQIIALPTALGTITPQSLTLFSGFQDGRRAWGQAAHLQMDQRGLFMSDPFNGDIWLIKAKAKDADIPRQSRLDTVLAQLRAAKIEQEQALKRDPLKAVYDSRFDRVDDAQNSTTQNASDRRNLANLRTPANSENFGARATQP